MIKSEDSGKSGYFCEESIEVKSTFCSEIYFYDLWDLLDLEE